MRIFKILMFVSLALPVFASSVISFSIEPAWAFPDSYIHVKEKKGYWAIAGEYGWFLNEHLILGPNINFGWHIEKKRTPLDNNTNWVHRKERIIMIPISLFTVVDPIPQYMIHPVFHAQVGYNSVFISNVDYDKNLPQDDKSDIKKRDGYYNGIIGKFSFECMFDIGKSISLFAGPQWQISTITRRGKDPTIDSKFNGFGFRLGVSALL